MQKSKIYCAFLATALLPYFVVLYYWDRILGMDWNYFNALSLVTRSSVLHFGTFPLHNPWFNGGMDLLANPQSRVLSPTFLLDLVFTPYAANVISLILYGFLGAIGMWRFLRLLQISPLISVLGAIWFINGSWFSLHYVEGHVAYGSMQLLPWILYGVFRLPSSRAALGLCATLVWMLLDGGVYAFGFSLLLIFSLGFIRWRAFAFVRRFFNLKTNFYLGCVVLATLFLFVARAFPIWVLFKERKSNFVLEGISFFDLLKIFFFPMQSNLMGLSSGPYRFHEYGCYIGVASVFIIGQALLFSKKYRRISLKWLGLAFFWFWIAYVGPGSKVFWDLYQSLPVYENLHVCSRLSILGFLAYSVAFALALNTLPKKKIFLLMFSWVFVESFFVRTYPLYNGYQTQSRSPLAHDLVIQNQINEVVPYGMGPEFLFMNKASVRTYDPASTRSRVIASDSMDYKGMAYVLEGEAQIVKVFMEPARMEIHYAGNSSFALGLNTNYLLGWKIDDDHGAVFGSNDNLVQAFLNPDRTRVVLTYAPFYKPIVFWFYGLGAAMMLFLFISRTRLMRLFSFHLPKRRKKPQEYVYPWGLRNNLASGRRSH